MLDELVPLDPHPANTRGIATVIAANKVFLFVMRTFTPVDD